MRYLVQPLLPALILIGVIHAVARSRKKHPPEARPQRDGLLPTPSFLLALVVGAAFAVAALFGVGAWAGPPGSRAGATPPAGVSPDPASPSRRRPGG